MILQPSKSKNHLFFHAEPVQDLFNLDAPVILHGVEALVWCLREGGMHDVV